MKAMIIARLFSIAIIVSASLALSATEEVEVAIVDGVEYSFVSNMRCAIIVGMRKLGDVNSSCLKIPNKLGGKRVRIIADEAFCGNFTGKREHTLAGWSWIREKDAKLGYKGIVLPKGLESIGRRAFYMCADVESINIPDSVFEIGSEAFAGCTSLKNITLPPSVEKIPASLFRKSGVVSVEIPDGVAEIQEDAFEDCENLKAITLPDTIVKMGTGAFQGCSALEKIKLSSNLSSIGYIAFAECVSLSYVDIPASVREIGDHAFWKCECLKRPVLPAGISVHKNAFDGCGKYDTGKDGVLFETKDQGENAVVITDIKGPASLTFLDIPETLQGKVVVGISLRGSRMRSPFSRGGIRYKFIGDFECISFPKTVVALDESQIGNFESAKFIKLMGVADIVDSAFYDNNTLEEIEIPAARKIGSHAFYKCVHLRSVIIPKTVDKIGQEAFEGCVSLTNVTFLSTLSEIPYEAFAGCMNLKNVVWPHNLKFIDRYAFKGCSMLQIDSFPGSLESIGFNAFEGCSNISRVAFPEGFTTFGCAAFRNCIALREVSIPESVKKLPYGLFEGCANLVIISLPADIKQDDNVFRGCAKISKKCSIDAEERKRCKQMETEGREREQNLDELSSKIDDITQEINKVQEAAERSVREQLMHVDTKSSIGEKLK